MEEKGLKISLAVFQSFLVIILAYLLSFVKDCIYFNGYPIHSPLSCLLY